MDAIASAFEKRCRQSWQDIYRANGFRQVQIHTKVDDNYQGMATSASPSTCKSRKGRKLWSAHSRS